MSAPLSAAALPASVAALNQLLAERSGRDRRRLPLALGISYAAHVLLALGLGIAASRTPYREFGAATSTGTIRATPLYGLGAPPGPKPRRVVNPPRARPPAPAPEPVPAAAVKPEPVAPPADSGIREHKPDRREPSRSPARSEPAARVPVSPAGTGKDAGKSEAPGGGSIPAATGGPGSPLGSLEGDPDGGLESIMFTDSWYVMRVRDIVYANWGNPFAGRAKPSGSLDVAIRFRVRRDGTIFDVSVSRPSGSAEWDRAGQRAVENSRLPPLPASYAGGTLAVIYNFQSDLTP